MKLLIVTPYYTPYIIGGAEISLQLLAEGLAKKKYDVTVLTLSYKYEERMCNGVRILSINNNSLFSVWDKTISHKPLTKDESHLLQFTPLMVMYKDYKLYTDIFKRNKFDLAIINSNEEWFGRPTLWKALKKSKIKIILTFRDPILLSANFFGLNIDKIYRKLVNYQLRYIDSVSAPSHYMLDLYKGYGISKRNSVVIYNAVDKTLKFNKNKKRQIIYAGTLETKKGIWTLIQAFKLLKAEEKDIELVFIGKGSCENEIKKEGYKVIGWVERNTLYNLINEAWVVVLPSEWPEAFGRTIIESVFNGTLAIGSNAGGIPEIFEGFEEFLFEQKNYNQLKDKLKYVFSLTIEQYHQKVEDMQKHWNKFTINSFINNWEKYINMVYRQ